MRATNPLVRAILTAMAGIAAQRAAFDKQLRESEIPQPGRGKGRNRPSYAHGNNTNAHRAANNPNGARAIARRKRQLESGMLKL